MLHRPAQIAHSGSWISGSAGLAKQPNLNESPLAVGFVDSDTLAVAWFVSHPPPSLGLAEPATLKAVYIDANTGKVRSKSEWTATSRPLEVDITPAGHLLVRTGQTLRLFSGELKPLQQQSFLTSVVFGLAVSPDGARAMVCPASQDSSAAQLLDTDTLQVLDTVPVIVRCADYVVGNKAILALDEKDSEVFFRTPGEPWHALPLLSANGMEPARGVHYTFLNENVLAVNSRYCSKSFSILTIEGKTLSTEKLPERRCWGSISTSAGGQYFGVLEERLRGIRNDVLETRSRRLSNSSSIVSLM